MRLLRALLVLLLCAVLPMTGLAASGLAEPCPVQMDGQEAHEAGQMAMSDCETMNDAPDSSKAKSPLCKVSIQCQLGSLYYPAPPSDLIRPTGLSQPVTFFYLHRVIGGDPSGLWRPPRAL